MAGIYTNNAEGKTTGTALLAGDTGSGRTFDTVTKTGAATITYSSAVAFEGTNSYLISAGASTQAVMIWTGENERSGKLTAYVYLNSYSASTGDVMLLRPASGTCAKLQIGTTGLVIVSNSAGTGVKTFGSVLSLSTWYRLELYCVVGATTSLGTIGATSYLGSSTTPIETWSSNAQNTGTANITQAQVGKVTNATATMNAYWDLLRWDSYNPSNTMNNYMFPRVGDGMGTTERIR